MKKLALDTVRQKLPFKISSDVTDFSIINVVENRYKDTFDYDVYLPTKGINLQRPLCWTLEQKQELVLSLLKDIKIPTLSVIKYRAEPAGGAPNIYKIIDGKQRLTTLVSFVKGEFPIVWEGETYFFKDLDEMGQYAVAHYTPTVRVAHEYDYDMISDDNKIAWFKMINFAGTAQDIQHLNTLENTKPIK